MHKLTGPSLTRHTSRLLYGCSLLCLTAVFFTSSCDKINLFPRPYVATVNEEKIYLDDYQHRLDAKKAALSKHGLMKQPNNIKLFEEEVLDALITEKIIDLRVKELGISVSSAELEEKIAEIKKDYGDGFSALLLQEKVRYEDWQEDLRKEIIFKKLIAADVNAQIRVSDDEAEDYYEANRQHYKMEGRVRVAQIVVRELDKAKELESRLKAGEDFAKLAQAASMGPESRRGGDLGFITRQTMPEPLDDTIFKLPTNQISPIVQSPYGFHIFKVLEIQPAKAGNFAAFKTAVVADIRAKKEEAAFVSWLEALKVKADVKKETTVLREKIKR